VHSIWNTAERASTPKDEVRELVESIKNGIKD